MKTPRDKWCLPARHRASWLQLALASGLVFVQDFMEEKGAENEDEIVRFIVLCDCGFRVVGGSSAKCDHYTARVTAG